MNERAKYTILLDFKLNPDKTSERATLVNKDNRKLQVRDKKFIYASLFAYDYNLGYSTIDFQEGNLK